MLHEQEIWISPKATGFTAVCDRCLTELQLDGYGGATVSGVLRLEDDHGLVECAHGHVITVQRADRALAGAIR